MKRVFAFVYGLVVYIIFLVAFLYTIGFVGNFVVPKSIDSGTESSLAEGLLINTILITVFAIQHSVMARSAFKKRWTKIIDPAIERSTYVLLSTAALCLIFWKWQPLVTVVWEAHNPISVLILNILFYVGWLLVILSTFMINHFDLFGLNQVFENLQSKKTSPSEFKMNFLYKLVRHPLMLGFLIAFWATPKMTIGHLLFSVGMTIYIFIAVKFFEEKDLRQSLGKAYEDYQKKVPMIIPFTKIKR